MICEEGEWQATVSREIRLVLNDLREDLLISALEEAIQARINACNYMPKPDDERLYTLHAQIEALESIKKQVKSRG